MIHPSAGSSKIPQIACHAPFGCQARGMHLPLAGDTRRARPHPPRTEGVVGRNDFRVREVPVEILLAEGVGPGVAMVGEQFLFIRRRQIWSSPSVGYSPTRDTL